MDAQTAMMAMQICETFAKKHQEDGLTKEESLTYEKMLVALGSHMRLLNLELEQQIESFEFSGCDDSGGGKRCDRNSRGDHGSDQVEGGVPQ